MIYDPASSPYRMLAIRISENSGYSIDMAEVGLHRTLSGDFGTVIRTSRRVMTHLKTSDPSSTNFGSWTR